MLARGIRSYHRPTRLEDAIQLAAQGIVPLAGGTRLLARSTEVPNVLDLSALELGGIETLDGDLHLGATVTLQEVIDTPLAYEATAGLLPAACRSQSPSRALRGMATLGGESVYGAHDSEVVAALLALNAVYVVAGRDGTLEIPALRFLKDPAADLAGGGLVKSIMIPGAPNGVALERVAVPASAPSVVAVAVTISFAREYVGRARIVFTGLEGRPARIVEAESRVEGTVGDEAALERCAEQVAASARFRDDLRASASYRRAAARPLTLRALRKALDQGRSGRPAEVPRVRSRPSSRAPKALPYFTSGRIEMDVNGRPLHAEGDARTTLLDLLRRNGFWGVKRGCETGDCGACSVLLDGRPVNACITLALRAQGRHVHTVEGLSSAEGLHAVASAFLAAGAVQCGYCSPAMELCTKALLDAVDDPSEEEIRDALAGCLCRCTGYVKPAQAVRDAAKNREAR